MSQMRFAKSIVTQADIESYSNDERKHLLLHIAITSPYDAGELSRRLGRPRKAIQDDIKFLMSEGTIHIHEGSLRTAHTSGIISEATAQEIKEIQNQVIAELETGSTLKPATLVALSESGCTDKTLLLMLIRAAGDYPDDATVISALGNVAEANELCDENLRLLRVEDAVTRGKPDTVLALTDSLLMSTNPDVKSRAGILAAGAHIQSNSLERATALYKHIGADQTGYDRVWAVVAALGQGKIEEAKMWRSHMGEIGLTSEAAGLADLADGIIASVESSGEAAIDLLARSVSNLAPMGTDVILPETPAALAAIIALGKGDPATAELLLDRAMRSNLGGISARHRHILLMAWSQMTQGLIEIAATTIKKIETPKQLCGRDKLLYWCVHAGIARRQTDYVEMREAWREIKGHSFGLSLTLYDLLPLSEMLVVAAKLRDSARVPDMVQAALTLLEKLDNPVCWAAPLHWQGVQAAFQAEDPTILIPHANALVKAGLTNPYAATLAHAGQTWLEVLRHETNFDRVEVTVRALAKSGHVWDAAKLAGQAALQHPEREGALAMMQLAREINKANSANTLTTKKNSLLTAREVEVGRLVLDGQGYRAIGEQLFISPKTVEHHVARMRTRLGATSRAELLEMLHDVMAEINARS